MSFLKYFLASVGVVLLSIVSSLGYNYYVDHQTNPLTEDNVINLNVQETVESFFNPQMTTAEEVYVLREQLAERERCTTEFLNIPDNVLPSIVKVVLGNKGSCTIKDIVDEFDKNYSHVYRHIAQPAENDTIKLPPSVESDTLLNTKNLQLIKEKRSNE